MTTAVPDRSADPVRRLGGYREYRPPRDVEGVVEAVWAYSRPVAHSPPIPEPGHRVLPESGVSVCLRCVRGDDGRVSDARLLLMGPIHTVRFFRPAPGLHLEAVRLKPEWCMELLGVHPAEHADGLDELGGVARSRSARLLEELARTSTTRAALAVLVRWIRALRTATPRASATELAHASLERIRSLRGSTLGLPGLAEDVGVSARHLRRLIRERLGTGPKQVQRVLRLNRTVAIADGLARPDWARLALRMGFYDQAHLSREFRALTGLPPSRLHAERRVQQRGGCARRAAPRERPRAERRTPRRRSPR